MTNEPQDKCEGGFLEILPLRFGAQREYTRGDPRRVPGSAYPAAGHFLFPRSGAQCVSPAALPLTLRVLPASRLGLNTCRPEEASTTPSQSLEVEPAYNRMDTRRGKRVNRQRKTLGAVALENVNTDTRALGNRAKTLRSPRVGRGVAVARDRQLELTLGKHNKLCVRCKLRPRYLNIKTLDLCEPCIWAFVKES